MDEILDLYVERTFHNIPYYLSVNASAEMLTVEIEQKSTGDSWIGQFPQIYIEEITQKTGNFKKYSTFLKMLQSAVNNHTEAVYIDVLTYQDLEQIKNKRKQAGPSQNQPMVQSNKRYLILSYIVEFDKVHYPLLLNFNETPNIQSLKNTIIKLRADNESLVTQISQFRREINPTDLLNEQMKEIEFLKNILEQKEREILEQKNLYHQTQSSMVKKSDFNDIRTKFLTVEAQNNEQQKKIAELEDCLSQVIDENQLLKQIDKKNKSRIQVLEQELQSTLSKRKPQNHHNLSRSPSLTRQKVAGLNKRKSAEKTTPIRQRKPSIDSGSESSFRHKIKSSIPQQSPSARSNSSKKGGKAGVQQSQKSFKKTINKSTTKQTTEDQEEQRLLQRLKDLREKNKENTITTPTSRMEQSSCDDLTSIDERLGKLTSMLRKVKQQ